MRNLAVGDITRGVKNRQGGTHQSYVRMKQDAQRLEMMKRGGVGGIVMGFCVLYEVHS